MNGELEKFFNSVTCMRERRNHNSTKECMLRLCLKKQIGVLCSWFSSTADPKVFEYTTEADKAITEHSFHPLQSYKCTLSQGCFELVEGSSAICSNVVKLDKDK